MLLQRWFYTWVLLAMVAGILLGATTARADTTVGVVGLRATDGDDDFARSLTGALRRAAQQVPGWAVSQRDVALAQLMIANSCSAPDDPCMHQIARSLNVQRVIYGAVSHTPDRQAFKIELFIFNSDSGRTESALNETLPLSRTDIDDLRLPARRFVVVLSGRAQVGTVRVHARVDGAHVFVDNHDVGAVQNGVLTSPGVASGAHEVTVTAPGYVAYRENIRVNVSDETVVNAVLRAEHGAGDSPTVEQAQIITSAATGARHRGSQADDADMALPTTHARTRVDEPMSVSSVNRLKLWGGIGAITVGAGFLGATIYAWVRMHAIDTDGDMQLYRTRFAAGDSGICADAANGDPGTTPTGGMPLGGALIQHVSSMCSEAKTLRALQYVFVTLGLAGVGVGAWLLATRDSGSESTSSPIAILPSFSHDGARLDFSLRF